ncbi:transmembrane protein [Cystoisospora suis]|uniref:Transmembrane protein n=1 Tax=Cystoisospora suis TaxID=483139 RepID=A0A2C6KF69_9APIC|nr:transmembrane protein [Cystoisospora suis]
MRKISSFSLAFLYQTRIHLVLLFACFVLLFIASGARRPANSSREKNILNSDESLERSQESDQPRQGLSSTSFEIQNDEVLSALDTWNGDLAVFFYVPWDVTSRHLLGLWDQARRHFESKDDKETTSSNKLIHFIYNYIPLPKSSLKLRHFNCEGNEGSRKICRQLGFSILPSILYFSYGTLRDSHVTRKKRSSFLFDEEEDSSLPPRCARYKGDFFIYDAVVDWLEMMRKISLFQQFFSRSGNQHTCKADKGVAYLDEDFRRKEKELAVCQERLESLEKENAVLRKKLEIHDKKEGISLSSEATKE